MNRKLALSVLLLLVAVAAVVVGGATTTDTLTTDSDFQGATTLDNVTVDGSGDAADVALADVLVAGDTTAREADDGSVTISGRSGLAIDPNTDMSGVSLTVSSNTAGVTTAYVTQTDGTVINSTSIAGGTAEIWADLQAGTTYYVTVDADGGDYSRGQDENPSYPYTGPDLDIVAGVTGGSIENSDRAPAIISVGSIAEVARTGGTYVSQELSGDDLATGEVDLSLTDAEATVIWQEDDDGDGTWSDITSSTYSSGGVQQTTFPSTHDSVRVRVDFSATTQSTADARVHDVSVAFNPESPTVDNGAASPQGGSRISSSPVTLSIPVEDPDFATQQDDSVTVDFYVNGSQVGTDTLTSNGTATTSYTPTDGGPLQWHAEVSDSFAESSDASSNIFQFTTPATLYIRNESDGDQLIDDGQVEVQFINEDEIVVENTSDGTVSMAGLPVGERFIVRATADGYHSRTVVVESIYQQDSVYLLNENVSSVETRFVLEDRTGNFDEAESEVVVLRAIERSGNTEYRRVVADEFGVAGVTANLAEDRYRIRVRNDDGDTRELGWYTASVAETATLQIGELSFAPGGNESYQWDAAFHNKSGPRVTFNFSDPADGTGDIDLTIYERGNESNRTIYNQTVTGPHGNASVSVPLTGDQNHLTWVVEWSATRDGERIGGSRIVGPRRGVVGELAPIWKHTIGVGMLLVVGGLFGGVRAELGSIVVVLFAGVLWYVRWLPEAIGVGIILFALVVAILYRVSSTRGVGV